MQINVSIKSETKVQLGAMFWLNKAQDWSHVVISSLQVISGVTLISQVHCKMSPRFGYKYTPCVESWFYPLSHSHTFTLCPTPQLPPHTEETGTPTKIKEIFFSFFYVLSQRRYLPQCITWKEDDPIRWLSELAHNWLLPHHLSSAELSYILVSFARSNWNV